MTEILCEAVGPFVMGTYICTVGVPKNPVLDVKAVKGSSFSEVTVEILASKMSICLMKCLSKEQRKVR